ncbi:hypothetical protein G6F50_016972 [Rhizopus delemar]|uniref:Uncharacterized protein n=1 Tax=Rhizopus delemar TaxID=936053 RepID=A0A9P6XRB0_9FUNG|nr:hypothetical protein G6F50_016972 [Rhizopus delemar]
MGWTRALAAARWRPAAPAGRGGLRTHAAGLPATGTPRALATRAAAADLRWPAVAGRRRRGHRSTFAGLVAGPWGATAVAPGRLSPENASPVAQFEQSLESLEQLVEQMETGELSLEASLSAYERGGGL